MESFATLIKSRKSTRKFTDQLLNPEQVEMILKAALMAPASKRKNPWQFVVVEDKEMLAKLSVANRQVLRPERLLRWLLLYWRM